MIVGVNNSQPYRFDENNVVYDGDPLGGLQTTPQQNKDLIKKSKEYTVSSGCADGKCTFYSILGSLYGDILPKINGELDLKKIGDVIGADVLDVMLEHEQNLTYILKDDIIVKLNDLATDLDMFGVIINIYQIKEKVKYVNVFGRNSGDLRGENKKRKEFIKQPLTLLEKLYSSPVTFRTNAVTKKCVNLAFYYTVGEMDVMYIKDISKFYRILSKKKRGDGVRTTSIDQAHICPLCDTVFAAKKAYESQVEKCNGKTAVKYDFTGILK